jgi:hypothetical protein
MNGHPTDPEPAGLWDVWPRWAMGHPTDPEPAGLWDVPLIVVLVDYGTSH